MRRALLCVVLLLARSAVSTEFRDSLRGLTTVVVAVEPLGERVKGIGLEEGVVRTRAEAALRRMGLKVSDGKADPAVPRVNVTCFVLPGGPHDGLYDYGVEMALIEPCKVQRLGSQALRCMTWFDSASGRTEGADYLYQALDHMLGIFEKE